MEDANIKSPGVYINEPSAFSNSVVPVATAIPAFIGYTPEAYYEGKSYLNVPMMITSFAEFKAIFCFPDPEAPASPAKQYAPQYYLVQQKSQPQKGDYLAINDAYYSLVPDPNTIYYLYNSVKLFYENGGGTACIVSVGSYGPPSKKPGNPGDQVVNPNVQLNNLLNGLALLLNYPEPTLYICPEATLLSPANNATLMQAMLSQCSQLQTAISIFDVIGGNNPDPVLYTNDIANFRNNTGTGGLDYGAAYYPFVGTTLMQNSDLDYTNLFNGDISQLAPLLNPAGNPDPAVATILANMANPASGLSIEQNNLALLNASQTYSLIMQQVLNDANLLPPSGGMAGIITTVDNTLGVWNAPANVSMIGVSSLPINLNDSQQANLNVDAVSGKSINAIRFFNGQGILVWGARTLDGNDQDWRYISVRRTMIYLEQSCKLAARAYAVQPNDKNTWEAAKSSISSFLTSVWQQGGLIGASASDAFSVECGLGTTMTSQDLLNGFMNIMVRVAITHPAEYIVFTIQQEMTTSG
jgi:hypothetical protein